MGKGFAGGSRTARKPRSAFPPEVAMKVTTNEDFAKQMMLMAKSAARFEPVADYDPDGDCIEFLAKPDPFYAERVDDLVTVYYSQETDEVIGSLIKGVKHLCADLLRKYPGLRIEIEDKGVRLVHIFRAKLWSSEPNLENKMMNLVYKKLIEVAEETNVAIDHEMDHLCAEQTSAAR
jgi:hypothetical protein